MTHRFAIPALLVVLVVVGCAEPPAPAKAAGGAPQRIVSLSPNITETLFALGLGDRVVGVTNFCSYPPAVKALPRIGGQYDPNPEAIAALRPDLVVLFDYQERIAREVAALGTPILMVPGKSLDNILGLVDRLGEACACPDAAHQLRAEMERRITAVRERTACLPRPSVLISVDRPLGNGIGSLYVAGTDNYFNTLIEYAGGRNAAAASPAPYPVVSAEDVAGMDPDTIVDLCVGAVDQGIDVAILRQDWSAVPTLAAVKSNRILVLTESYATVPGPRTVQFLEQLAAFLHPAAEGAAP